MESARYGGWCRQVMTLAGENMEQENRWKELSAQWVGVLIGEDLTIP